MEKSQEISTKPEFEKKVKHYSDLINLAKKEIAKAVVGQEVVINSLIEALIANGHVLLEGVPGIGKTLLVRTIATIIGCSYSRIQFTPDLLPTDIVGVTTYEEGRGFFTLKGPVFANFVLGDEINRSPPKVQSALLEAMQEKQVTIGKETFDLPSPFFVMATQNPVENLGTYKLPEAQLDRFLFKVMMRYPSMEEEELVTKQNMTLHKFENFELESVFTADDILDLQSEVKNVFIHDKIIKYIIKIIDATRHPSKYKLEACSKYLEFGASPRASIAFFIASKAHALVKSRAYVTHKDVKDIAHNVLRHRILLNFEGQADNIDPDYLIDEILKNIEIL